VCCRDEKRVWPLKGASKKKGGVKMLRILGMRRMLAATIMGCLLGLYFWGFSQEKITITIQTYWRSTESTPRFIEQVLIPEFAKRYPNVEVKLVYVPGGELLPTILMQAASGTLPEIIMADNPWVPQLIEAGVFKDITREVMAALDWSDFFEGHRLVTSKDGRIYALQLHTNNLALFYRKSLLEKAGVDKVPATWDELLEACEKIKATLGIYGFVMYAAADEAGTWQFEPFLWTNGGSLLELDQPEAIEALQFLTTLVERGYMPRDVVNVTDQGDVTVRWFLTGEAAMMINGNWEFGWHLTPDVLQQLGDVGVAPIPVPKEGLKPIVPFGGECFGIASTIDPQKFAIAWEFIKLWFVEKIGEYYQWSGHIPTRASYTHMVWEAQPLQRPFLEQAQYALPRPLMGGIEKYPNVSMETILAVQKALTGIQTPQQAFIEAANKIRSLFTPEEYEMYRKMARDILDQTRARMLAGG
jgi:multiple sugar transport system substrate-binding protein